MKNETELRLEMDFAVKLRDLSRLKHLSEQYIKKDQESVRCRLFISECYRRLSRYDIALKVLKWSPNTDHWDRVSFEEIQLRVQTARIVNLLGGSKFALNVCDRIPVKLREKLREIIAPIYLANYRYKETLELSQIYLETLDSSSSYTHRMRGLLATDALAGLHRCDEALMGAGRILELSDEPLMKGIVHQAKAEYFLKSRRSSDSIESIRDAHECIPVTDKSQDRGNILKTEAEVLIEQNELQAASKILHEAWEIFYQPGFKPEIWLELLVLMGRIEAKTKKGFPKVWASVLAYPSPTPFLQNLIRKLSANQIPELSFHLEAKNKSVLSMLEFNQKFEVITLHPSKKAPQVGFTLIDRVIMALTAAGQYGIPQYRLHDFLWPDQYFSGNTLHKRLEQAAIQCRIQGFNVEWSQRHLKLLKSGKNISVTHSFKPPIKGGDFLSKHARFRRDAVEQYYALSKTQATAICTEWLKNNWIKRIGNGRNQSYVSNLVLSSD